MRTVIVTGAYGAIGRAIVTGIAAMPDYHVAMVGRDPVKLDKAYEEIVHTGNFTNISRIALDVSSKAEIMQFAQKLEGPVHVVVNNAASSPRQRLLTKEGIEVQFATNVLGYVWMMEYLSPLMQNVDDARIVNVASYWAGNLDSDDLEFKTRKYDNDTSYRQSKQADRMLSIAFAEKFKVLGITVNSCHPGDVNSKLSNDLGFGGHQTPAEGAATPVFLATSPKIKGITGKYFADKKEVHCEFSSDRYGIQRLAEICSKY